jgi:colanic acid/amylovoran biosynthesis glycosyltransferase
VLKANLGSANFFLGALGIFPKSVYFARVVKNRGIGHVHAHYATHPALAAYIVSALTGVGFSFTAHAHDIFVDTHMLAEKLEKARFVVAISRFNKAYLLRHAPSVAAEKIKVVHCGVDLASHDSCSEPEPERDAGNEADRAMTAVCVASLQPYKGIKYLVRACAQVVRRVPSFRCVVVGEGVDRPELEALIADLGLQTKVRLAGGMPQHEVAKLLRQADLFVLPSIVARSGQMEGIPVALMEAMASRRPVVATRLSGIPELVEDGVNGLLVPSEDEAALAEAITQLASDPELRRRMGERGRETITAQFELRGNVERLRALFEAVLRGGEAGPARLEDPCEPAGVHRGRHLVSGGRQD